MTTVTTLAKRCAVFCFALGVGLGSLFAAAPVANEYLQDDATIDGRQINFFTDGNEQVAVVNGDFRFEVGRRVISGNQGVVWINTLGKTAAARHDITIYVNGNARIDDIDSSTTDEMMLVRVHIEGLVTAKSTAVTSNKSLLNSGLYRKARQTRIEELQMLAAAKKRASSQGMKIEEKSLVVRKSAQPEANETPAAERTEQNAEKAAEIPLAVTGEKPSKLAAETAPASKAGQTTGGEPSPISVEMAGVKEGKEATPPASVNFEATKGIEVLKDPEDPNKRIIVSKGPVYISQGPPKSYQHIELQAQSAVVFTQTKAVGPESDEKVPYAPKLVGAGVNDNETVTGVYLDGDVIISRGERKLMGKTAYYDFIEQKALVLKPVFRTIQEQRNIPIYIRATEARMLGPREIAFNNAIVSTSDFKTPEYSINSKNVKFRDETVYDDNGERLSANRYAVDYDNSTFEVRGVPIFFLPPGQSTFEQEHTALRSVAVGHEGNLGFGAESKWFLFRLLGIVKPKWLDAMLTVSGYEKGAVLGVDYDYAQQEGNRQFSGYGLLYGTYDTNKYDEFGQDNKQLVEHDMRGRILMRHKEYLPKDWEISAEFSYLSDSNYLQEYFADEYYTGKEQENLVYVKKQRDNWAITGLVNARLNDFLSQTESLPEVAAFLIGQPILDDTMTFYSENRVGGKRWAYSSESPTTSDGAEYANQDSSNTMFRGDTRQEVSLPLRVDTPYGPLNVAPYLVGRVTGWSDTLPSESGGTRPYIQAGVRSNMSFWRVYNNAKSRLFDVNRLRHVITPEVVFYTSAAGGPSQEDLYQLDEGIENINDTTGVLLSLKQRLETKRGAPGQERTVDWMRLNIDFAWFDKNAEYTPGNGTFYFDRPEDSIARRYVGFDYSWNISDRTVLMADAKYDIEEGRLDIANVGIAIQRDPRLSYFAGFRYIQELEAAVGTVGFDYVINKKYSIRAMEQYDFKFDDGNNLGTSFMIVRRFPRWNVGVDFSYDNRETGEDAVTVMLMLWPEGIPEARLGGGRYNLLSQSNKN
ncbi:MAG TPA: hypothetical protein PKK48_02795 [Phycisphaerae bacterium]|nr:hypothetical protein [Phycisphaerae bacterium]HPS52225.1 hypothetical protein [Phycisphaerae bacterium]